MDIHHVGHCQVCQFVDIALYISLVWFHLLILLTMYGGWLSLDCTFAVFGWGQPLFNPGGICNSHNGVVSL